MENSQADTIIGVDVTVKGNLLNKGSIHVNGTVEGEIKSDENIVIGENANVNGPVTAIFVLISGKATGTIEAKDKLEIDPTGIVNGDIKAKTIIVREGAKFNGNCSMTETGEKSDVIAKNEIDKESEIKKETEDEKKETKSSFWDKSKK